MELVPHFIVVALATVLLLITMKTLTIRQHPLFFFVLGQAFIYCFIAPTYNLHLNNRGDEMLVNWYLYVQLACLILFLPTFVLVYMQMTRLCHQKRSEPQVVVAVNRVSLLSFFSILGSMAFLMALLYCGLLYRRIGHSGLATEYLNMWPPLFYFIRISDRLLLSLVLINYIVYSQVKSGPLRITAFMGFIAPLCVQLIVCGLNSRLHLVVTIVLLSAVHLLCVGSRVKKRGMLAPFRLILGACVVLYGINFTVNVRHFWNGTLMDTIEPSLFLTSVLDTYADEMLGEAAQRLDGIDLMARMSPELYKNGFSCGSSWMPGIIATVGFIWDPVLAREIKSNLATTPKYYLMYEYAGINQPDYSSCILTDAYGNFGLFGICGAATVLGITCAFARQSLVSPSNRLTLIFGVVMLQVITEFEGALLSHLLLGWIQFAPSAIFLTILAPFRTTRTWRPTRPPRCARMQLIGTP